MFPKCTHTQIKFYNQKARQDTCRGVGAPTLHNEEAKHSDASAAVKHLAACTKAICGNLLYSLENRSTVLITILSNAVHYYKLQLKLLSTQRPRFREGYVQTKTKTTTSRDKQRLRAGKEKRKEMT